ncbi:type I-C CRISPR-associated protein Cas5c [Meiothermus hypogaeus]|uniref:pre-crRNA processing endonuclease n=2 Tax=Meiothermus hypogaeus TaxID=884155 RepID=A0A511R1A6_9DEIN|nr:type I-C CRISPR-associated protein Cas5c [Meiothermus hypogaeus]RIH80785.1 CRISPR pre-crRNA endoribonuclease Cas5d [Meiothermus hypogaeus]GEM83388.1 type I-C CRISPR-associated protein Cas5 [Meiothermus hypogaeus NBRC 106114]
MRSFMLEVWGELACFTRPEFKVERFSYPLITPSAARGIFDAIYLDFDPQSKKSLMYWQVERIEVLRPVRYISLMRNEVKEKASLRNIQAWMKDPASLEPLYADATRDETGQDTRGRTQRQTMALKDVRYRLSAHAVLYREDPALRQKIEHSFERRARAGQCIYQPYLGCREFTGYFRLAESGEEARPVDYNEKIGWMLYDVYNLSRPGSPLRTDKGEKPRISLFEAEVVKGVLLVPPYDSEQVKKGVG